MNEPAFADTFYYLAFLALRDPAHDAAVAFAASERATVTTAWVLTELADGLASTGGRAAAVELMRDLQRDPLVEIVPPTLDLFTRGLALYSDRPDKRWSLTDCTSFVAMRDRDLTDALTGDHHFEQAGFTPRLRA